MLVCHSNYAKEPFDLIYYTGIRGFNIDKSGLYNHSNGDPIMYMDYYIGTPVAGRISRSVHGG